MALTDLTRDDFTALADVFRTHVERGATDELPNFALALTTVFESAGVATFDTDRFLTRAGVLPDATIF